MSEALSTIGERIKRVRKNLGLSQAELADKLGMLNSNISNLERGTATPTLPTVLKLSELSGESVNWIVTGSHENTLQETATYSNTSSSTSNGGTQYGGHQKVNFGGSADSGSTNEWKEIAQERKLEIIELKEENRELKEEIKALEAK